jgi:predicted NBD/HSP70 family sugar kinase
MDLSSNAALCGCGKKGCLETLCSKTGMVSEIVNCVHVKLYFCNLFFFKVRWMRAQGSKTWLDKKLPGWRESGAEMPGSKLLRKCVKRNDALVCAAIATAANALGAAIANVLTTTGEFTPKRKWGCSYLIQQQVSRRVL